MKTAQQYYDEAIEAHMNNQPDGDCVPFDAFIVPAMQQYARDVTMAHLQEIDRVFYNEYNLSTDPEIETP